MGKTIFDSVELNNLKVKNRIVRSATWEALADEDGGPVEEQVEIYEELAKGGTGLLITGFTSVDRHDNEFGGLARIYDEKLAERWGEIPRRTHSYNVPVIMQLALGEFVRDGRRLEADNISREQIREIVELFGDAAQRVQKVGFDGVQIHAAHGFYLSRFISPAYNHRTDEYGGDTEKRAEILLEILRGIKQKAPGIHVTMKINCTDFMPGGLTPEMSAETILHMEKEGLDSVEISANGTSVSGIKAGCNESYYLPFAKGLKKLSSIPIILVGGHRSLDNMNRIVSEENIEMLSLSRPLIREPDLIARWASGDTKPAKCISCNSCYHTQAHRCVFRD